MSCILAGCSSSAPKCSDSETTDLVLEISYEELARQLGSDLTSVMEKFNLAVNAIRTTDENEKTGAYACAAQLDFIGEGNSESLPITYTVELTDDGEQFYVSVLGLQ